VVDSAATGIRSWELATTALPIMAVPMGVAIATLLFQLA
jgi:hypothetical protein